MNANSYSRSVTGRQDARVLAELFRRIGLALVADEHQVKRVKPAIVVALPKRRLMRAAA